MSWTAVGNIDDFPLDQIKEVLVAGGVMAVVRTASGVHAFDNNCAHMGVALSRGRIEGDTVICPMHNWAYDLRSSRIIYPPTAGRRFATFYTKVEGDTVMVWPAPRPEGESRCDGTACATQPAPG
jgi:nitrite reductase (NADH) small subunit